MGVGSTLSDIHITRTYTLAQTSNTHTHTCTLPIKSVGFACVVLVEKKMFNSLHTLVLVVNLGLGLCLAHSEEDPYLHRQR